MSNEFLSIGQVILSYTCSISKLCLHATGYFAVELLLRKTPIDSCTASVAEHIMVLAGQTSALPGPSTAVAQPAAACAPHSSGAGALQVSPGGTSC